MTYTAHEIGNMDVPALRHALTVDVEDYFQVSGFERSIARDDWPQYESRVVANTERVLELFARHDVTATFFVLGWTAEQHPDLVRRIAAAGHEIGSHSTWHRLVYELSPEAFRTDLRRSKATLEAACGRPVVAYRAPSFSITQKSLWALEILCEEGFTIDSSIFPVHHDRYGIPGAERFLHQLETKAGPLWEFPPSIDRMLGVAIPIAGGGYFRLYPYAWTKFCLQRVERLGRPLMFYLHPWELDPEQPRLAAGSRMGRFRHYVNLRSTAGKLERLVRDFRFGTVSAAIAADAAMQPAAAKAERHVLRKEATV